MGNIVAQWVALFLTSRWSLVQIPVVRRPFVVKFACSPSIDVCALVFFTVQTCRTGKLDVLNFVNTYDYVTHCDSLQVYF